MKTLRVLIISVVVVFCISTLTRAQAPEPATTVDVAALAARWPGLSNAAFVKDVSEIDQANWDAESLKKYELAFSEEAARRIRGTLSYANDDIPVLSRLVEWAVAVLTPEEQLAVRTRLANQLRNNTAASLEELANVFLAHTALGGPTEERVAWVKEWVGRNDVSPLSLDDMAWCMRSLASASGYRNRGMHVTWTGEIRPPSGGQYTFSAIPTQIEINYSYFDCQSSTKVYIDDQLILEANAKGTNSKPVNLSADQQRSIRIEFDYKHSGNGCSPPHPAAAMLFWQGPGIAKQLVPPSALIPPQGKGAGPGLWGEYSATQPDDAEGHPQPPLTAAGIDRQIDFLWTHGRTFLLRDRSALDPLVAAFVDKVTSPEFLAELRKEDSFSGVSGWIRISEMMTSAQRARCLRALMSDPAVLRRMSARELLIILHAYRVGAEQDAIELIGKWSQVHASDSPQPAISYFEANRQLYYWIADHFTYELKDGCIRLEEQFLELPDGKCALPAAYIVAYSRGYRGELDQWIASLDARLSLPTLGGDQRAGWLIARAQAEEMRGNTGAVRRFQMFPERYHAGWEYLDEASLVAESEPIKLQVFLEKITRAAAIRPHEVPEMLAGAKTTLTAPDSMARLAALEKDLERTREGEARDQLIQAKSSATRYIKRLKRRQSLAAKRKDSQAVDRYSTRIEAAEAAMAPPQ